MTAGNGMLYARTRRGYTFAWGCGSQGQLGVGGSTKGNPLAQRMPGAHQITQITGARGGHFGAAVDTQGRVLTFGAGVPTHGLMQLLVGLVLWHVLVTMYWSEFRCNTAMWGWEGNSERGEGPAKLAGAASPPQISQHSSGVQAGQGSWGMGTRTSASSRAWSSLCCKCACCAWLRAPSLLWPSPGAGLSPFL